MQIFIVRDRQANITYPGALKETDWEMRQINAVAEQTLFLRWLQQCRKWGNKLLTGKAEMKEVAFKSQHHNGVCPFLKQQKGIAFFINKALIRFQAQ